jgi:general secretion pathway protein H
MKTTLQGITIIVKRPPYNLFFTSHYNRRDKGFTLIELLIVLTILAIASGIVGVLLHRGSGTLDLKKTAKHIAATLRYARSHAVSEKKVYSFIVLDNKKYGLYEDYSYDDDPEESAPVLSESIPESLTVTFENQEERKRIDFFPRGSSSGGTVVIDNQKGKYLFIIVNRITGRVVIKKSLDED